MSGTIEQVARAICCPDGKCAAEWDGPLMQGRPLICRAIGRDVQARAAITAFGVALAEQGYVIVPREATKKMLQAGFIDSRYDAGYSTREDVWRAMIEARPSAEDIQHKAPASD